MRLDRRRFCGAVALLAGLLPAMTRAQAVNPPPSLAGVWQLNAALSTPPAASTSDENRDSRAGRGPRAGGRLGGRRGGRVDEAQMARARQAARELMQPAARLTIVQRDATFTLTDDEGRVRTFTTDGSAQTHQGEAATVQSRAEWKDGSLQITWSSDRGPKVVRTYRVLPETSQLVIETRVDAARGRERPPVRHVYDAARLE